MWFKNFFKQLLSVLLLFIITCYTDQTICEKIKAERASYQISRSGSRIGYYATEYYNADGKCYFKKTDGSWDSIDLPVDIIDCSD